MLSDVDNATECNHRTFLTPCRSKVILTQAHKCVKGFFEVRICYPTPMDELIQKLRRFADERDWEQYHSPKNLSMALTVEAAELMEHLQWLTEEESRDLDPETRKKVEQEIGDIQIYLARLADKLGIDPMKAAHEKLEINAAKYPVEKAKGNARKYTELE